MKNSLRRMPPSAPSSRVAGRPADWGIPLAGRLATRRPACYLEHSSSDRRRRPVTPVGNSPFCVLPLTVAGPTGDACGLLLLGGVTRLTADVEWFASVLAQK